MLARSLSVGTSFSRPHLGHWIRPPAWSAGTSSGCEQRQLKWIIEAVPIICGRSNACPDKGSWCRIRLEAREGKGLDHASAADCVGAAYFKRRCRCPGYKQSRGAEKIAV